MPISTNESLSDAAVRHQVFLERYGGSTANDIIGLLDRAERDLEARLKARIAKLGPISGQQVGAGLVTSKRLERLLKEIKAQNHDLRVAIGKKVKTDLRALTRLESDLTARRLTEAVGVDLNWQRPSPELLNAIVSGEVVRGQTLNQWFTRMEGARFQRLESAVRLGLVEGDTLPQIVNRFRAAENVTRAHARTLVRTSVNAVANQSRMALFNANDDVIKAVKWTSTLDSRTSDICMALDGEVYRVGTSHPFPPAHPNCRSTLVPITKSWRELGATNLNRKRGSTSRDALFRQQLAKKGFSKKQIDSAVLDSRASMNGQVPAKLTYNDWLKRQPNEFQDQVLGPTKAKLFRDGGLTLDKFVDIRTGRSFTLEDLKTMESAAWARAFGGKVVTVADPIFEDRLEAKLRKLRFAERARRRARIDPLEAKAAQEIADISELGPQAAKKQAFVKLSADPEFLKLSPTAALTQINNELALLKAQKLQAVHLSNAKKNLQAGKPLTKAQAAVVDSLDEESKAAFLGQGRAFQQAQKATESLDKFAGASPQNKLLVAQATGTPQEKLAQVRIWAESNKTAQNTFTDFIKTQSHAIDNIDDKLGQISTPVKLKLTDVEIAEINAPYAPARELFKKAASGQTTWLDAIDEITFLQQEAIRDQAQSLGNAVAAKKIIKHAESLSPAYAKTISGITTPTSGALDVLVQNVNTQAAALKKIDDLIDSSLKRTPDNLMVQFSKLTDETFNIVDSKSPLAGLDHLNAQLPLLKLQGKAKGEIDDILAATKNTAEKKAALALQKSGTLEALAPDEALAQIKQNAAVIKAKQATAANLTGAKKKLAAGKPLTPKQQAAVDSLSPAEKATFNQAVAKLQADDLEDLLSEAFDQAPPATPTVLSEASFKRVAAKPGGSVPGYVGRHEGTGERWIIKQVSSDDIARNEMLSAELYKAAGIDVPDVRLIKLENGRMGVASKWLDDLTVDKDALLKQAGTPSISEGFVTDAWLANWDVVGLGYDNLVMVAGKPMRIDVGGALRYRAQGGLKGAAFADDVPELRTLRNSGINPTSAHVFKNVTDEHLRRGAARLAAVTDEQIEDLVEKFGPEDLAERASLVKTLQARKRFILNQYDVEPTPAPVAPAKVPTVSGVTNDEITRISQARQNGYTILTDKDGIEDQAVRVWHETHTGKPSTGMLLKVRGDVQDKLNGMVGAGATGLPGEVAQVRKWISDLDDQVLASVKGIAAQANQGGVIRAKDIERVNDARMKLDRAKRLSVKRLKEADGLIIDEAAIAAQLRIAEDMVEELEKAIAPGQEAKAVWGGKQWGGVSLPEIKLTQGDGPSIVWTEVKGFEQRKIEAGRATTTGQRFNDDIRGFETTIDGVRIRYWDDTAPFALRGRVEVLSEGTDLLSTQRGMNALEKLGMDVTRAQAIDREELYLRQIANHAKVGLSGVNRLKSAEKRIERMAEILTKELDLKTDIRQLPDYNPFGTSQAFEQGRVNLLRPDLPGKTSWQFFELENALHHQVTGGITIPEALDRVLGSGGVMAPTTDKLRRGIGLAGMSPGPDLQSGGASYFFTRIKSRSNALFEAGFVWKPTHLRRLDSISYADDLYGKTSSDSFIRSNRKSGVEEWGRIADRGGNETIFKDGLSIFDDLLHIVVSSEDERAEVLNILRKHKIDRWPDGRSIEEVVGVRGKIKVD